MAKKEQILKVQAKERMEAGTNQYSPKTNLAEGSKPQIRDQLAKEAGVSPMTYTALKTGYFP